MPLVCQDCYSAKKKVLKFFQVSREFNGETYSRQVKQPSSGLRIGTWALDEKATKPDGIYCSNCFSTINEPLLSAEEKELLKDNRFETMSFSDYPIQNIIETIKNVNKQAGSNVHQYSIAKKSAEYGELATPLNEHIAERLREKGIEKFYSHQAEAINRIKNGENIVITTGTASGKSLVYTVPALDALITDKDCTVLYLSPLKALTRDQLASLEMFDETPTQEGSVLGYKEITIGGTKIHAGVLEGGKADAFKEMTYEKARYWLTNVHFLHFILQGAVHFKTRQKYANFFKNLKYVIIDELHAYNGVLGTKVAMLLRRLRSLCNALGSNIQFIACSASIGNPKELAEEITGLKGKLGFSLINKDGSPAYERDILLWNPGYLGQQVETRTRRAPITEAIDILRTILQKYNKLPKTIIFYGNRRATSTTSFELNNALKSLLHEKQEKNGEMSSELFTPFHAQINSLKKQEIMKKIKSNELVGIVSTSALEMGIDIGDLELCIMIGYAGNKASFLQQAGRVGRKGPGLVIQIFQENPLEQYYANNPTEFMEREAEQVTIDVSNSTIVSEHIQYAAHELNGTITSAHKYFKISAARKEETFFNNMEELGFGKWRLINENIQYKNLLNSSKVYDVISQQGMNRDILFEGVDERSLLRDYHYGAVFLYNNRTYKVRRISTSKNEIITEPFKADYTTRSQIKDSIYVLEKTDGVSSSLLIDLNKGALDITRRLWGYKKVSLFGGGVSDIVEEGAMYPVKYTTNGLWLQMRNEITDAALHVVEHAIASAIPTIVKCSHSDFSLLSSSNLKEFDFKPTIVCYETGGGGSGIIETVIDRLPHILKKALNILKACSCHSGCPNCTHLSFCERNNESLDKQNGIQLLEQLLADKFVMN